MSFFRCSKCGTVGLHPMTGDLWSVDKTQSLPVEIEMFGWRTRDGKPMCPQCCGLGAITRQCDRYLREQEFEQEYGTEGWWE